MSIYETTQVAALATQNKVLHADNERLGEQLGDSVHNCNLLAEKVASLSAALETAREALRIVGGDYRGHDLTDYLRAHGDPSCVTLADQLSAVARIARAALPSEDATR